MPTKFAKLSPTQLSVTWEEIVFILFFLKGRPDRIWFQSIICVSVALFYFIFQVLADLICLLKKQIMRCVCQEVLWGMVFSAIL